MERSNPTTSVKVIQTAIPRVGISADALAKMYIYVQECSDEIGWLGTVQALESGKHFIIDDVYLFDQDVHGATTEITPEGLAEFGEALLSQPDGVDIWNRMQLWGHSHVNRAINPSGQDDKQMQEFANIGHDFFIRLICNKKGDMKVDFYNYKQGITYLDVPWEVLATSEENSIQEEIYKLQLELETLQENREAIYTEPIKAEMKEKVHKFTYTQPAKPIVGNQFGYWQDGKWIRTDNEKKMTHGTTNTTTNTGGGATSKKKTEEINEEKASSLLDDFFKSDDEVVETFSMWELMTFGEFTNFLELEEEIEYYGYDELTDNDIERIFRVAKKYKSTNYRGL